MGILCLAVLGLSAALVCPDGGMCEDRNTCCKNTAGGYGCCPLPHAECCSDHLHCCYEGMACDLVHSKCVNKTVSLPWVRRLPATHALLQVDFQAIICSDQRSECPDETTCCELLDGSWGCCPLAKAVCCEDKLHCCPENAKCDLVHSRCLFSSLQSFPMLEKVPARKREKYSVTCPGGQSSCPDSFTCCLLTSGDYGCCPYPEAVCCSDHIHCCPANTVCDLEQGVCRAGETHIPPLKIAAVPNDIECPDKSACPDQTTCCQMANRTYGCCPMPHVSHSLEPDLQELTGSYSSTISLFWRTRFLVLLVFSTVSLTLLFCVLQAVCCEDHTHCCRDGKVCNLAAQTCDDPSGLLPPLGWVEKVSVVPSEVRSEKCDRQTMCPGGSTCCKKESGLWACCPLPQAVCCGNHEHCCPQGYKCNAAARTCDRPWLKKEPSRAVSRPNPPARNMCDGQTSCPRDTTCCFMEQSHRWGCCPLPNAVCCHDGDHCCPSGHSCEPHRASCSKGPHVIPWFTKLSAVTELGAVTDVKCDDKSSCASGTTCCKLPTGEWGCCPLVKAVCCADHEHCCPQGYTCNMRTGTCEKTNLAARISSLPQSAVVRSEPRDTASSVACDSTGEFRCPPQDTCCQTSATEWACCPSPRAVCCSGSKRCCPAGSTCDLKSGGCTQNRPSWDTLFWSRKRDSVPHGL
uniref:Granulins domain-containing protein n=1 Tax=Mola mola TaxID=94237 RepID=A0A3Q3VYW6_MOLML